MQVGALEETITVSGETPTVDLRNVVQQQVLTNEVRELLPSGRSVQMMAQILPGITQNPVSRPSGQDVGGLSGERGSLMIHGSRATTSASRWTDCRSTSAARAGTPPTT